MDFDGLDDLLDDNSYVPSFAAKTASKKTVVSKEKIGSGEIDKNKSESSGFGSSRFGGLIGAHKETRKEATTFEDFFSKQKEEEKSNTLNNNRSTSSLNIKEDDYDPISLLNGSQRTNMRRPLSKGKESEKEIEKNEEFESPTMPRRNMMPPLNKKNQSTKVETIGKVDNFSIDANDSYSTAKVGLVKGKSTNELDPLDGLSKEENKEMKRMFEQQMSMQKNGLEKIVEEERASKKQEIESLKRLHEEELKKKIELKDFEIQKLKEFYEMQINLKTDLNSEKKELNHTNYKIEENLKELKKIELRINEQYKEIEKSQKDENSSNNNRKEFQLERREKELDSLEKRLFDLQTELRSEKERFYKEQDRERDRLDEMSLKLNQRENELESKYKRKEKELNEESDKKRTELNNEKEKVRFEQMETQQKKLQVEEQERELKSKIKTFEEKQREILDELHQQRTRQIEKDIEMSSKLSQISMKESEVEMEKQDFLNKMKILDLERKKLEAESKSHLKSTLTSNDHFSSQRNFFGRSSAEKLNTTGSFEQYQRTISQMRDEMMKTIPKF